MSIRPTSNETLTASSGKMMGSATTKTQQLVGKLLGNKRSVATYKFPLDLDTRGDASMILFNINAQDGSKYIGDKYKVVNGKKARIQDNKSASLARKLSNQNHRIDTSIALYMPHQVQSSYSSNWNTSDLGIMGAVIDAGTSIGDMSWDNAERIWGIIKTAVPEMAKNLAAGTLQALTSLNAVDAKAFYTRTVANPYMEVIFNGVNNRTFSFSFKMTPRNSAEQQEIKNIVNTFKFHRAPEVKYGNINNYWLFPSTFDIKFLYGTSENEWLFKISTCALTNFSVKYGGEGGYNIYKDGSPLMTEMTLEFMEMENLTKERIDQGF